MGAAEKLDIAGKDWLTVDEAAHYCGVSRSQFRLKHRGIRNRAAQFHGQETLRKSRPLLCNLRFPTMVTSIDPYSIIPQLPPQLPMVPGMPGAPGPDGLPLPAANDPAALAMQDPGLQLPPEMLPPEPELPAA